MSNRQLPDALKLINKEVEQMSDAKGGVTGYKTRILNKGRMQGAAIATLSIGTILFVGGIIQKAIKKANEKKRALENASKGKNRISK